ncbi:hypothetical protein CJ030_MR1G006192 [Morella rubra]|uniref:Uncharacterized protein n=1 Tax=Morella rubra TaxID=262757 RepID=A0A6A1WK84_9ROSI|nr:hypothetical protein CJ030_MR1G006192 [Morella rubra]
MVFNFVRSSNHRYTDGNAVILGLCDPLSTMEHREKRAASRHIPTFLASGFEKYPPL